MEIYPVLGVVFLLLCLLAIVVINLFYSQKTSDLTHEEAAFQSLELEQDMQIW